MEEDKIRNIISSILKTNETVLVSKEQSSQSDRLQQIQEKKEKELLEGMKQDRLQRKDIANFVFHFTSVYMAAVFTIVMLDGCKNSFSLSDSVINTILATTTANVLGIMVIVVTYFFNTRKK